MFKKISIYIVVISLSLVFHQCGEKSLESREGFFAYYTDSNQPDEITGPFPDVVVNVDEKKQVIFGRETSYLPYLVSENGEFPFGEIIPRSGDGSATRPDKNNIYSYVRIISQSPEEILIHWRYMANMNNVDFEGVVHEYFTFYTDGRVQREIRAGEKDLVDFHDPKNKTTQSIKLTDMGLEIVSMKNARLSKKDILPIEGNPVKVELVGKPVLVWRFDEALKERAYEEKDFTFQTRTMVPCKISGNLTLWKAGVSGTALAFDGYNSKITMASGVFPRQIESWAFEGWVALGAYPWKWGALIDLTKDSQGLSLGITDLGEFGFKFNQGNTKLKFVSEKQIPLNEWTHFGITYNKKSNKVTLYINGKPAGESILNIDVLPVPDYEMVIGLNKDPDITTEHVSRDYEEDQRTSKRQSTNDLWN